MAFEGQVYVHGLRNLNRALRVVDVDTRRGLRVRLRAVAEMAAVKVRAAVPRGTGAWARSIRAGANTRSAYITWGRKTVPYAPWVEFGGTIRQPRRGVSISREFIREGRYVYPTVKAYDPAIAQAAVDAVEDAARKGGFI